MLAPAGSGFPWTTFAINVSGCFALACLPAAATVRDRPAMAAALGPGLLGGYTTMSAYAEETRALLADDRVATAAAYAVGTVARLPPRRGAGRAADRADPDDSGRAVTPLLVALGAAVGAPLRYWLAQRSTERASRSGSGSPMSSARRRSACWSGSGRKAGPSRYWASASAGRSRPSPRSRCRPSASGRGAGPRTPWRPSPGRWRSVRSATRWVPRLRRSRARAAARRRCRSGAPPRAPR